MQIIHEFEDEGGTTRLAPTEPWEVVKTIVQRTINIPGGALDTVVFTHQIRPPSFETKRTIKDAMTDELLKIDTALREAGIEYPRGATGVRDLAHLYKTEVELRQEYQELFKKYMIFVSVTNDITIDDEAREIAKGVVRFTDDEWSTMLEIYTTFTTE